MTLSELRDLLNTYLDRHPHAAPLVVRFREVGYDGVQEPTEDIALEAEDGAAYAVLTTREP